MLHMPRNFAVVAKMYRYAGELLKAVKEKYVEIDAIQIVSSGLVEISFSRPHHFTIKTYIQTCDVAAEVVTQLRGDIRVTLDVIGDIYGVARSLINKMCDELNKEEDEEEEVEEEEEFDIG